MGAFETVKKTIEDQKLLEQGDCIVVGFSGGPDSMCLLHILWRLAKWDICAVHVNHSLRGAEADKDQLHAEEFCKELGIPCTVYCFDVNAIAKGQGLSTEDAGRRVRYQAFEQTRKQLAESKKPPQKSRVQPPQRTATKGRCCIAVAQNANDQAETVLMRIMRGTGLAGLGAMSYEREDGIIRPLLDVPREDVEAYCKEQKLIPCIDATNLEPDYTRNRIRLELLPYIRKHFNENIVEALNRLAGITREDQAVLEEEVNRIIESEAIEQHRESESAGKIVKNLRFSRKVLQDQPAALRRRIVLRLFAGLGLDKNISAVHLEAADRIIKEGTTSGAVDFPMGYRLRISYEDVIFEKRPDAAADTKAGTEASVEAEARIHGKPEFQLDAEIVRKETVGNPRSLEPECRAFDWQAVKDSGFEPVLRTRRAGDYIRPLGMKGTKKLQDYFVDKKVDKEKRDEIPMVCLGREVIWITADGITGEPYKVREDTEDILLLRLRL